MGSGCRRAPAVEPSLLRPVLDRAVAGLRPLHPEDATLVEELRREAEERSAAVAAAPWWRRRQEVADAAWLAAVSKAARCMSELARHAATASERWQTAIQAGTAETRRARELLPSPGMGQEEAAAVRRAELLLDTARQLAASGRLDDAAATAEQASVVVLVVERRWAEEHDRFDDPSRRERWQELVLETVEGSRRNGSPAVVVDKLGRRLTLYESGRATLVLPAELGTNGLKRKRHAGDGATPEGRYRVTVKKEGAATRYYKALLIDYPNPEDLQRFHAGQADGTVPPGVGPGSLIEIHGGGGSGRDWTDGCVALTDGDMDRLYSRVRVGTPVVIVGTVERLPAGSAG